MTKATLLGSRGLRAKRQVVRFQNNCSQRSGVIHPHRLENFRKILVPGPQLNKPKECESLGIKSEH